MTLFDLNGLSRQQAFDLFLASCGSTRWADEMVGRRPYSSIRGLVALADEVWFSLSEKDWKEAFSAHPRIGDVENLRKTFGSEGQWASGEQSGVVGASGKVLEALAEGNAAYESKFGYIFIVSATGKRADEMLALLDKRLNNTPSEEIRIAAQEQAKITRLRLEKSLFAPARHHGSK